MNKALICVDVQYDFLPGGPLGVPDGHQVIRPLIELMDDVDVIVLTRDWHPENHVSFSTFWPMHCVEGTPGARWDAELLAAATDTGKPVLLVHKGFDPDKEAYSGFDGTVVGILNDPQGDDFRDATLKQAFTALSVSKVLVGGLALDYCVEATARDAKFNGYQTTVYLDATRPVAYQTGTKAVRDLALNGVYLDTTKLT